MRSDETPGETPTLDGHGDLAKSALPEMETATGTGDEILYVQDALCGWCYGHAPIIEQLQRWAGGRHVRWTPVHGGLWPGTGARRMDAALTDHLRRGMPQVTAATGQAFGTAFRERIVGNPDFLYDTEPAARAAITLRSFDPQREQAFIHDTQKALFVDAQDPTRTETFAALAERHGVTAATFSARCDSEALRRQTQAEFALARSWGVHVFPTLLLRRGVQRHVVSAGSSPLDSLLRTLEHLLSQPG